MSKETSTNDLPSAGGFAMTRGRVLVAGGAASLAVLATVAALAASPTATPVHINPALHSQTPTSTPSPAPAATGIDGSMMVPFAAGDRLSKMDQLRAELEQVNIEADIAKKKAEIRTAAGGSTALASGSAIPPIPGLAMPAQNLGLLPPLPVADTPVRPPATAPSIPRPTAYQVIEAWGSGPSRQAVLRAAVGGDRIVHVGDHVGNEVVAAIVDGVVKLRDRRGAIRIIT